MSDDEQPVLDVPVPGKSRGGAWVRLGDERYRIPPLGFLAIQELEEDIKSLAQMAKVPNGGQMRVIAGIVHAALVRNYPSTPVEEVIAMLDLGNYQDVLSQVLQITGYKRDAPSGEATASTGPASTSA